MKCYNNVLLTTSYFPPIAYFGALSLAEKVELEAHENYQRQTYRNRCCLYMANGVETLTVPVERTTSPKTNVRDMRIAYHMSWQKQHLRSIESAYGRSAYYEFYIDNLMPFFTKKPVFLFDMNLAIMQELMQLIGINCSISMTDNYLQTPGDGTLDARPVSDPQINPYLILPIAPVLPYEQVFALKHGFQPLLSILDLLFHTGPETKSRMMSHYGACDAS